MSNALKNVKTFVFLCLIVLETGAFADELNFGRVRVGDSQVDTLVLNDINPVDLMVSELPVAHPAFVFSSNPFTGDMTHALSGSVLRLPVVFSPQSLGEASTNLHIQAGQIDLNWELKGLGVDEVIVFNEVLADPPSGLVGDANRDGVRTSVGDEFVELFNTGNYAIDISGWQLFDAGASKTNRFTFPEKTHMGSGERVVVFGGGNLENLPSRSFVDDGKIGGGLRNSGDVIYLVDPASEDTVAQMVYGSEGGRNTSLVRAPEGIGGWELHNTVSIAGDLFSPGVATNEVLDTPSVVGVRVSCRDSVLLVGDSVELMVWAISSEGTQTLLTDGYSVRLSDSTVLETVQGDYVTQSIGQVIVTVSYEEFLASTSIGVFNRGDLNFDGFYTLWDAIRMIHLILDLVTDDVDFERRSADLNQDQLLDIRDLIVLIQRIIGGPLVSEKMVLPDGKLGWAATKEGVLLALPHHTRVVSFDLVGAGQDQTPTTAFGEMVCKSGATGLSGILILHRDGTMDVSTRVIEIKGLSALSQTQWVAWGLDGQAYPLKNMTAGTERVRLENIFPNPLNPSTVIHYEVASPQDIVIEIYNVTGQRVRELFRGRVKTGEHAVVWDTKDALGRPVGSGLYFANLRGKVNQSVLKMIVLR